MIYDWSGGVSSDNYIDHFWKELFENGPQLLPVPKKRSPWKLQQKSNDESFGTVTVAGREPPRLVGSCKKKASAAVRLTWQGASSKNSHYVPPFFSTKLSQIQPTQRSLGFSWGFCWYISPIKFSRERHHHQVQIAAHHLDVLQPSVALLPGSIGFAQLGFQTHSAVPG